MNVTGLRPRAGVGSLIMLILSLAAGWCGASKLGENIGAGEIMVVQAPFTGTLTWHTTPGMKWQGFGAITKYHKRSQLWFSAKPDQGKRENESLRIRFNDGGHANMSGSIAWEMPNDTDHLTLVHTKYTSQEAVETQLVKTVVEKAVYMTGPLMSSQESYAARRPEILQLIEDQVQHGVYKTSVKETTTKDVMSGQDKTVKITEIAKDKDGNLLRNDKSPLDEFGIRTFNPSLNEITYDETVEAQIKQQQAATMQVQTAQAKAREAEQEAITATQNGKALAAKAQWEQEVIRAKVVTEAQQQLDVARLGAQAAEQTKRKEILLGEGESERRRLNMTADGALDKKLETWLKSQEFWANAVKDLKGNLVPGVVMGGSGSTNAGANGVALADMLMTKFARDLALDMSMVGTNQTKRLQ